MCYRYSGTSEIRIKMGCGTSKLTQREQVRMATTLLMQATVDKLSGCTEAEYKKKMIDILLVLRPGLNPEALEAKWKIEDINKLIEYEVCILM